MDDKNPIIPAAGTARLTGVELVGDGEKISLCTQQVVGWQKNDRGGFTPVANIEPDWFWFWETWDAETTTELLVVRKLLQEVADLGGHDDFKTVAEFAAAVLQTLPNGDV